MPARDSTTDYGSVTKFFHWALLVLLLIEVPLGLAFGFFSRGSTAAAMVYPTHAPVGILVLLTAIAFLVWRLANPRPSLAHITPWQRLLARLVHALLFLVVIVQPLLGLGHVLIGGHGIAIFGLFTIPSPWDGNEQLAAVFSGAHRVVAFTVVVAVAVHVLGALYHHFVARDAVLKRMLPGRR